MNANTIQYCWLTKIYMPNNNEFSDKIGSIGFRLSTRGSYATGGSFSNNKYYLKYKSWTHPYVSYKVSCCSDLVCYNNINICYINNHDGNNERMYNDLNNSISVINGSIDFE